MATQANTEERGFKAEVQQLLDLMIHSLYSDREIFVRELVSNAADALDKARFTGLTETIEPVGHDGDPSIRITVDAEANTLTFEDDGIGLTEAEAIENLGTIAHSGSKTFLGKLADGDKPDLIGQFGVGFYASFMVADRVVVESKSAIPGEAAVLWTSEGKGTYTVGASDRTARGTSITLHLREDAHDFADEGKIRQIVRKHSNFVSWPVLVADATANEGKALWHEAPSDVSDEAANEFYKSLTYDFTDPVLRIHTKVDTPFQYAAMLFVPGARPFDLFNPEADIGPRLYAKRVLITDHASDLLPKWLRFVRGVVDSEDISLNVSREMVQKTPVVRKLRTALTKKILKELARFANNNAEEYATVWDNFGMVLKEGHHLAADKERELILPLLRFDTNTRDADGPLVSLEAYKEAMPEGQDAIWYLTAESRDAALSSPHLEAFVKRGWPVLLLTDPIDEWLVQTLTEYADLPLKSVSRGELDLEESDETDKAEVADLTGWMKTLFDAELGDVRASSRLTDSACVLVDAEHGLSSNMERLLREANHGVPTTKRVLEINPKHPLIRTLAQLHEAGRTEDAEPVARLLYDDAVLLDGSVKDPAAIGRRLQDLLARYAERALQA